MWRKGLKLRIELWEQMFRVRDWARASFLASARKIFIVTAICFPHPINSDQNNLDLSVQSFVDGVDLSTNGSEMSFYFFITTPTHIHSYIGIYDIVNEKLRLFKSERNTIWHSPTLSFDSRKIGLVQFCWSADCSEDALGHQIVILDAVTGNRVWSTSGSSMVEVFRSCCDRSLKSSFIVRSLPAFSTGGDIYYTGAERLEDLEDDRDPYYTQSQDFQLLTTRMETEEEILLFKDKKFYTFRSIDRIRYLEGGQIFISGSDPIYRDVDASERDIYYPKEDLEKGLAYLFDPSSDRLSIIIQDKAIRGKIFCDGRFCDVKESFVIADHHYAINEADISYDGTVKILSARGALSEDEKPNRYAIMIVSGGNVNTLYVSEKNSNIIRSSISRDGRFVVVGTEGAPFTQILLDLNSGSIKTIDLKPLLEQALENDSIDG